MTNKSLAVNFFEVMRDVLSKNTSKDYSLVVLGKLKKELLHIYPFFEYVHFKNTGVMVDNKINEVHSTKIGKLFIKMIDILGASLLKMMIAEELDTQTVSNLEKIGVRIFNNIK